MLKAFVLGSHTQENARTCPNRGRYPQFLWITLWQTDVSAHVIERLG
jgi:hypothetical protein